ncbi:hypothetical protein ACWKWC_04855 [Geodermatophilus nigrescens]
MSEPALRRELLGISEDQWSRLLVLVPTLGEQVDASLRRRPDDRVVDGRAIKRWIAQPQQHRGRLEPWVLRCVQALLSGLSTPARLPTGAQEWHAVLDRVLEEHGRTAASVCRAYAVADGHAVSGQHAPDRVAQPSTTLPAAQEAPGPQVSDGGFAPALDRARADARSLVAALTAAVGEVTVGHALPDLSEPAGVWRRTRTRLLEQLGLTADDERGFDELAAVAQALEEAEQARLEAMAARENEARLTREREELTASLSELGTTLRDASPVLRRGLELARDDVLARLEELGGPAVEPAGAVRADAAEDTGTEDTGTEDTGTEDTGTEDTGTVLEVTGHPSVAPVVPSQVAPDPDPRTAAQAPDPDLGSAAQEPGSTQPPAEHGSARRPGSEVRGSEVRVPAAPDTGPSPQPATAEDLPDADALVVSLAVAGRLAEAYWAQAIADPSSLRARVLRFATAAFGTGSPGLDATEVLVEGRQDLAADVLAAGPVDTVVVLASTLRAGLSARWAPFELLDGRLVERVPEGWRPLVTALVEALQDGYQHRGGVVVAHEDLPTAAELAERARRLRTELQGAGLSYQRATVVLRHLLRDDEPLGTALQAVERWADGDLPVARLAEQAGQLTDPRSVGRVIDDATRAVSTAKQRKSPIIAKALQQLQHRIDQVGQLLLLAVTADAGSRAEDDSVDGRRAELLAVLAEQCPDLPPTDPGAVVLERLRAWLLDPTAAPAARAASVDDLLLDASLPLTGAVRDAAGAPETDTIDPVAALRALADPPSPEDLFSAYLDRGDLASAARLEFRVPHGAERLRESAEGWAAHLEHRSRAVMGDLARIPVTVPLDAAERSAFEARLVGVRTWRGDRYDRAAAELRSVAEELDGLQRRAQTDMRARLDRLPRLDAGDRTRIESLIDSNDLTTAHEFLAFLERGDHLPPEDDDELRALVEFTSLWRGPAEEAMTFDEALTALGGPEAGERVEEGLRAWRALPGVRTAMDAAQHVRPVLRLLGLELSDLPSNETARGRQGVFTFVTRNARPVDGSVVPGLGSRANRHLIRVVRERTSGSALLDLIPAERRQDANILLYPGRLTERDRIDLLTSCRRRNVHAIVVDDAVIAYVAQRAPGSFRTTQQVTLPFAAFPHYAPYVAGDVADEVFVGRRREMDEIASPSGSLFVYGGRQLGKSALLRRVERDFNRVPGQHAIFIDLKARGIGEFNKPEHLWVVLLEELKRLGLVPASFTSTKAESVVHHMRDWLEADSTRRILLLLDEADLFLENEARERQLQNRVARFPNVLQLKGLMDLTNRRFKPVFAGLHQVQRLQDISNSPLAHGGQDILIGPLLQSEARGLVLRPLSALGYRFHSPDLVWRLLAVTNYQASLVQIVCFELVEHMTRRMPARSEPPFVISAADVDEVVMSQDVQARIAQRFQLTIRLEDRYFVIALTLAVLSLDSRFREAYTAEDLLAWCRMYWPGGFDPLTTEQFRHYLDEMVGLGVMVRRPENRYAVRSPNVVTMLGTREELEQQLHERADSFDLPHDYNPRATRRLITLPDRRTERSPLTEQDLAAFFASPALEVPPLVVVGSPALGLDRVARVLQTVAGDREHTVTVTGPDDLHPVTVRGSHVIERRPLIVVDCSAADSEATQAALLAVGDAHRQRLGKRAVLVGPSGLDALSQHDPRMITVIPLGRWTSEGLRSWNDNPFASPEHREALLRASGGWPGLVEAAVAEAGSRSTVVDVVEHVRAFPGDLPTATAFLGDVGLSGSPDLPLVRTWAQVTLDGERVGRPDLADLLELPPGALERLLTRLGWLGVIGDVDDAPVLDTVVRRALLLEG